MRHGPWPINRTIWRIYWPFYLELCEYRHRGDPEGVHCGSNLGYRWIARGYYTLIWKAGSQ